jgi:fructokinase
MVVHIVDPSVIVLGGGLSNIAGLPELVQEQLGTFVFGGEAQTQVRRHLHGDSSGVRGAAWL